MDLPPYHHHHHHHRYVHQRPLNVSHNPNYYHHHHPPPPPPTQRPPPPLQPHIHNLRPPPPPPHHHHISSQFSFPSENPRFYNYPPNRQSPPRVSSNLTLNQPPYHYRNPPPPSPRFIVDDFVSNRVSSVNDNNQEPVWVRRENLEFNYDDDQRHRLDRRRIMEIDVNVNPPSRDFRSRSPQNYELRDDRRRMDIGVNPPSSDFRSSHRNYDDRFEGERREYGGNVDEVLIGSSSRRMSSLDNGNDRFSNRLRVDKEEITHWSPQKKKSALLRIQCGKANNNRSRNQENQDNGVRGKQKDVFERLERKVEVREEREMELNVSFKSNALVAKAIMTPSSPAIDSDRSETPPRSKKIRKVNSGSPMKERTGDDSEKGDGSANDSGRLSSSNKGSKCLADKITVSAGGSSSNSKLDSNKDSSHLVEKVTDSAGGSSSNGTLNSNKASSLLVEKVTDSAGGSSSNSKLDYNKDSSHLVEKVTDSAGGSSSYSKLDSNKDSNHLVEKVTDSAGRSSSNVTLNSSKGSKFLPFFIVRKKKTVTKKKVTTPFKVGVDPGNAIDSRQQDESFVESVERISSDDMTTLNDVNVKLPSDEVVSKLDKPSKLAAVSKDESVEQSTSDGKKASPAKVLVSSSMDSEINDVADYTGRSVQSGPSMLNSEPCMIEVQNKPTSFDADNTGNVGGHSEDGLRVSEDGPIKECSEAMACVERNGDGVLPSLGGRKTHKDEVSSSTKDTYVSADSDLGFSDGKKNAVAAMGSFEAGSVEPSSDPNIVPLLTSTQGRLRESFLNGNDSSFNPDETGRVAAVNDLQTAECLSNSDPSAGAFGGSFESYVDVVTLSPETRHAAGDLQTAECLSNSDPSAGTFDVNFESYVDVVTLSPETRHANGSDNTVVSVGDDIRVIVDDDCLPKVTRKRKITDDESVLLSTKMSETEENEVCSLLGQGKFSCLRGDHASKEKEVTVPGNGSDSLKGDRSHGGPSEEKLSLQDCFKDDSNSCSRKSPKEREVSSPAKVKSVPCVATHEEPSSMPITVPLINDVPATELESRNTLSNVDDGPPARPSVTMLESSTAKNVCQAEPFEDDLVDHFSDVQQVIAHNFQLGAVGQETTTSAVSVEPLGMANRVTEDKGSSLGIDQKLASECRESHNYVLDKDDIPLLADNLSLFDKSSVKSRESVSVMSPLGSFPEDLLNNSASEEPNYKSSMSSEIVFAKSQNVENTVTAYDHVSSSVQTSSDTSEFDRSSDHKVAGGPLVNVNTVPLSSKNTVKSTKNVSSQSWKPDLLANQQNPAGPRVPSVRPSSFITSRNVPISKKPLTWHRTDSTSPSVVGRGLQMNSLPPQSHLPKNVAKVTSYVRKGNSLVRNPSPVGSLSKGYHAPSSSVSRLNSSGVNDLKRKPGDRTEIIDSPSCRGTPEVNAPSERPETPPQSEPFSCTTLKSTSLPAVDHPGNGGIAANSDPLEVTDNISAVKPSEHPSTSSALPECQIGLGGNSESPNTLDEGSSRKNIVYVKKRSNQLVAASDKTQTSSDAYYKRRKNQLIRASSNNHMKQRVATAKNIVPFQRGMKRLNGLAKTSKLSKFSLVWKLGDTQSSRKSGGTLGYEKLWPYLFPWKRASYRRSFLSSSSSDSSSIIRRKLLLSKKRETIYTRSIHGLSLRRSKVLSVSGSSLKWSKSIEQRSKKAAEEAALAVADVDRRKRRQDGSNADSMNGNNVSRERIFRIGYERYKMDPSGKTLQRISDEEPSVSVPEAKKSYIPKRLLIGNDEYVRVGNGNKLVRNPKRRVRILASEKVRWSLHTARIRLARKKQYCQFFTRFGKCNKDNGKCPYIHDPSKIAVCTKFLNGSCSDTNCKLTHEVIPERMQDCSYFLQGICSNENCPYRHVNVNPNASLCEGFLRGYCADGNECQKKHTYVCPVFEATGNCPQGSKCKLHHPKNKRKGVKRKASSELKNGRGRYFGSPHVDISERVTAGLEKPSVKENSDIFFKEGKFVDFISLEGSDEEEQTIDQRSEQTPLCDSVPAEMQLDDLDELIKPMRLINRNRSVGSSAHIASASDMTTSYVSEESQTLSIVN
ncbi:uncharacterized protein LOC132627172 isoform X2 [Lycium barbarum]|uniref:uncharacterized protein LOC132627172 isoform X2 n=1 Tax=Lycium barbarum TaxID=112863 RepID=UPI00293E2E8D|nr:uncharacterized protein LOC132627172 isoform X2 [Lycium barbarum]